MKMCGAGIGICHVLQRKLLQPLLRATKYDFQIVVVVVDAIAVVLRFQFRIDLCHSVGFVEISQFGPMQQHNDRVQ